MHYFLQYYNTKKCLLGKFYFSLTACIGIFSIPALGTSKTSRVVASSRNPFFFCCFEQHCKPSPSPVFPAFTNLGQTGGTKGASNAIRCRFFRSPARHLPLPPNNPSFRPSSSLRGPHLLFSLCSACCCQKTSSFFLWSQDNRGCRASTPHYSEPRTARYWGATNLRNIPSETSCPQAATI